MNLTTSKTKLLVRPKEKKTINIFKIQQVWENIFINLMKGIYLQYNIY